MIRLAALLLAALALVSFAAPVSACNPSAVFLVQQGSYGVSAASTCGAGASLYGNASIDPNVLLLAQLQASGCGVGYGLNAGFLPAYGVGISGRIGRFGGVRVDRFGRVHFR